MLQKYIQFADPRRWRQRVGPWRKRFIPPLTSWLEKHPCGIRFKLTLLTLVLIALITTGSSLVVTRILDDSLLKSLIQRGSSLVLTVATPAGYSLLSGDVLALDNLAAKITAAQEDVAYLAILNANEQVVAHNQLEVVGKRFERLQGKEVTATGDYAVLEVVRGGLPTFEFLAPIIFADRQVGTVAIGIDAAPYHTAQALARNRIFWISILALCFGLAGTLLLSAHFTLPIKRLAAGVASISAGNYDVQVETISHDELGALTGSFNSMTRTIRAQKKGLENSAHELEQSYLATVRILAAALDARDNYTLHHSTRVASLSMRLGRRLGLAENDLLDLEIGCFLHDIGKIRVPDNVLCKPGPLSAAEAELFRRHPEEGAAILELSSSLCKYVPVVRHHHEWYDGSGYPAGLNGEDIPLFARIVAISDAYDAMTTSRPYRPGRSPEDAVEEIKTFRGRQFAPDIADQFIAVVHEETGDEFSFSGDCPG